MKHLLQNKTGSTLTEYAVILGLIALVGWGAISGLGVDATNVFNFVGKGAADANAKANTTGLAGAEALGK